MMTRILTRGYLWLLLALLYSPILIIMIFSFTEAKVLGNWTGFSTKLYSSLFTGGMHHSLINAIWNTFAIALLCRHRQYGAGQHCSHRHLQSALAHTAGNELRQCHPDDECRHYHRCVAVPAVRQLRHIARIHHSGTGTHHFLHALRGAQRNAPAQKDEPECLRGGTRPGRHTVPSTAQGYSSGDISGYDKRIHPCFHALHRRLCRDHLHHRQPGAGNALHLHLRRCAQRWTDAGTAATSTIIFVTVLVLLIVINKRAERTKTIDVE